MPTTYENTQSGGVRVNRIDPNSEVYEFEENADVSQVLSGGKIIAQTAPNKNLVLDLSDVPVTWSSEIVNGGDGQPWGNAGSRGQAIRSDYEQSQRHTRKRRRVHVRRLG